MKSKDFEFTRGDTKTIVFQIIDLNGNPLEATDGELYFTFKENEKTQNYIFQKTLSNGGIVKEGDILRIPIKHKDTATLKVDKDYYYDICYISSDKSYVETLVDGNFTFTREATWLANEY